MKDQSFITGAERNSQAISPNHEL